MTNVDDEFSSATKTCDSMILVSAASCRQRTVRRLLRSAVRQRDLATLRTLFAELSVDGAASHVINITLSDALSCSALSYAARCGYLEVVEVFVDLSGCHVDHVDRNGRSALDEAIAGWAAAVTLNTVGKPQHDCARRYRIVRCLLDAGVSCLSRPALDVVLSSALDTDSGQLFLSRLVKVFCEKGCVQVKTALLSVLLFRRGSCAMLASLLASNADPDVCLQWTSVAVQTTLPFDNAVVMVRTTSHSPLLAHIDRMTNVELDVAAVGDAWPRYRRLIGLLTLAGHRIRLPASDWLRRRHAGLYRWTVSYWSAARSLRHLARIAVRRAVGPNVIAAVQHIDQLPTMLRLFLLLGEL